MVHRSESELNFDNIIFANRNQAYGAYDIRNIYNSHLKTAVFISFVFFSTLLLTPTIIGFFRADIVPPTFKPAGKGPIIIALPPTIIPPVSVIEPPKVTTVTSKELLPFEITDKDIIEKPIVDQKDVTKGTPPDPDAKGDGGLVGFGGEDGKGKEIIEVKEEKREIIVDEKSEFLGDYYKFLKNIVVYPYKAKQEKIQGKVFVRFVIEKDGTVSDVRIARSASKELNEEAIRVVQLTSGKWSVAKKNGVPVRYETSLSIDFQLVEDE